MAKLTMTVGSDGQNYCLPHGSEVLCPDLFAELMNNETLPDEIEVTVSTEPLRGASRVSVLLWGVKSRGLPAAGGQWIDWNGERELLWQAAAEQLRILGLPRERWTDIWIDWAPIQPKKGNRR